MPGLQTRVLFLATSKSGKSVEAQVKVRHGMRHGYAFIVGDHMFQWHKPAWYARQLYPGQIRFVHTQNLEKLCQLACEQANKGIPTIVVFDEIDLAVNSRKPVPEDSCIYEVFHMGRNFRPSGAEDVKWPHLYPVGIWGMARRPGSLRPDLKDTLDRVYIGRAQGKRNVEWIEDTADEDGVGAKARRKVAGEWTIIDLQ